MNFLYYRMNSLMFKTKILILVFFFISIHIDLLHSQSHFLGRIVDDANQFIPYAKVSWLGTNGRYFDASVCNCCFLFGSFGYI